MSVNSQSADQEGFEFERANANQYAAGYGACTKAMHKNQLPNNWQGGADQVEI